MHVKEIYVDGVNLTNSSSPVTFGADTKAVYHIEIDSQSEKSLSISFKVFNNKEPYRDLAFARVKFVGDDLSGLPHGLTALLDKNSTILSPYGTDQLILTLTTNNDVNSSTVSVDVLGNTLFDCGGLIQGHGTLLDIPIIIK